jgi:hypothetical protein
MFTYPEDYSQKPRGNQIINLTRVANLGSPPVTEAEAKTKCRVTFTDDDTEFTALILRAIRFVENKLNISIIYQRIELIALFETEWKLPYGPVIGLESVMDSQGMQGSGPISYATTESDYTIDGDLYCASGYYRQKIAYTAGNFCPDDLKELILEVTSFLYENRGKEVDVTKVGEIIMSNGSHYFVPLWI